MKLEYIENAIYEAIRLKIIERGYLPDETLYLPNNSAGYKAAIDAIKASGKKIIYLENTGSYKGREDLEENCIILDIEDFAPSQTGTKSIPVYAYNEANDNYDKTLTAEGIYDLEYRVTMVVYDAKYIQIIHEIIQSALKFRQELSAIDEDGAALSETFVLWRRNYITLDSKKFAERSIFYEVPSVDIDGCTDAGQVAKNIEIEIEVAPSDETILTDVSQVFLTTKAGIGGSVIPEYTDEPFRLGDFSSVFGLADNGYRFLKWIEEVLLNPATILMNRTKILTAEFIQQFQLTTSVDGNGSITPSSGIYDDGDSVEIEVIPDVDNQFENLQITDNEGTTIITENPYLLVMDKAKEVIGHVISSITTIQNVFSTIPILKVDKWVYPDLSGEENDIEVTKTQVGWFDGSTSALTFTNQGFSTQSPYYRRIGTIEDLSETKYLWSRRTGGIDYFLYVTTAGLLTFRIYNTLGGLSIIDEQITEGLTDELDIIAYFDDVTKTQFLSVNGREASKAYNFTLNNTADDIINIDAAFNNVAKNKGYIRYLELGEVNGDNSKYNFEHTSGGDCIDNSLNNRNGVLGGLDSARWSVKRNEIEPVCLTRGCTIHTLDSNPVFKRRVVYRTDGTSNPITFSGYTKLRDYPDGFIDTENELIQADDDRLKEISLLNSLGMYDVGGAPLELTYDDYNALVTGANFEITNTNGLIKPMLFFLLDYNMMDKNGVLMQDINGVQMESLPYGEI